MSGNNAERMLVQLRIDRALMRRVDHLAIDLDLRRVRAVERLLSAALDAHRAHPPNQKCQVCA